MGCETLGHPNPRDSGATGYVWLWVSKGGALHCGRARNSTRVGGQSQVGCSGLEAHRLFQVLSSTLGGARGDSYAMGRTLVPVPGWRAFSVH